MQFICTRKINVQRKGISKQNTYNCFHRSEQKLKGRREGEAGNTGFTLVLFTSELVTVEPLL